MVKIFSLDFLRQLFPLGFLQVIEDELNTTQSRLEDLKVVLKLQDDLRDELMLLKEKQVLVSRLSKQGFTQNQDIKHQVN